MQKPQVISLQKASEMTGLSRPMLSYLIDSGKVDFGFIVKRKGKQNYHRCFKAQVERFIKERL